MAQPKPANQHKQPQQRVVLLATDGSHSIIAEVADATPNTIGYSAYGEQSAQQPIATQLGFNGQLREAKIGWYLLGNGYRAYNPRLMRFHSPDSWSPFGRGGLNPYMYCVGDPLNRSDPTGHWGVIALLSSARGIGAMGYITSTFGTGMNAGSLIFGGRITLANGLGMISGVTGIAAGLSAMLDLVPQASQLLSATSLISGAASTYFGARSVRTLFRHTGWYEAPFSRPAGSPPAYSELYPLPGVSRIAPSSPPPYPLNRSAMLPAPAGDKLPNYSRQDPNLFSTPLLEADDARTLSAFPEPIGVNGGLRTRRQTQLRRETLDRMDGLPISTTIRQRK